MNPLKNKFSCSLDSSARIITISVCVIFTALPVIILKKSFETPYPENLFLIALASIIFLVGFIAFLLRPRFYTVTNGTIAVVRLIKTILIPKEEIEVIHSINYKDLSISIRLFGSGGLWGYFGLFSSLRFGKLKFHATRLDRLVLIKTKTKGTYIISPNDIDDFLLISPAHEEHDVIHQRS